MSSRYGGHVAHGRRQPPQDNARREANQSDDRTLHPHGRRHHQAVTATLCILRAHAGAVVCHCRLRCVENKYKCAKKAENADKEKQEGDEPSAANTKPRTRTNASKKVAVVASKATVAPSKKQQKKKRAIKKQKADGESESAGSLDNERIWDIGAFVMARPTRKRRSSIDSDERKTAIVSESSCLNVWI